MSSQSFDDKEFANGFLLSTINLIASKYGLSITNIDMDNQIIELDGPEEKQVECAMELSSVLNNYLV